jgi:SNF2 family DNA or RNA helicase
MKQLEDVYGGGILSHDMGLGKTITMISCMKQRGKIDGKPNLILCPLSILTHWQREINKVYQGNKQRILIYHGIGRHRKNIVDYDYVVSTYYSLVTNELAEYDWGYIVIDEAHIIRNGIKNADVQKPIPKMCTGAFAISRKCEYRWCITGTPYNNRISDVISLFKFLQIKPYHTPTWWNKNSSKEHKLCMDMFCLQKTKENILQPKNFHVVQVDPVPMEVGPLYFILHSVCMIQAQYVREHNPVVKAELQKKLCRIITVARLISDCMYYSKYLGLEEEEPDLVKPDKKKHPLLPLKEKAECNVCFTIVDDPVQESKCKKVFCRACMNTWLQINPTCPFCRTNIDTQQVFKHTIKRIPITTDIILEHCAKINTVIRELETWLDRDPVGKVIIFSEFTSILSLLKQVILEKVLVVDVYLFTGDLTAKARGTNVDNFLRMDGRKKVLLISIKAGGVGLNLMPCSTIFLVEPNLNPFIEIQAENRVHRIGQLYQVNIVRFILNNSMDTKMQKGINGKITEAHDILVF